MSSLDTKEAFGRIDLLFLKELLSQLGFKDVFVEWIKMFYKKPKFGVRVKNRCTDILPLGRYLPVCLL